MQTPPGSLGIILEVYIGLADDFTGIAMDKKSLTTPSRVMVENWRWK